MALAPLPLPRAGGPLRRPVRSGGTTSPPFVMSIADVPSPTSGDGFPYHWTASIAKKTMNHKDLYEIRRKIPQSKQEQRNKRVDVL